MKVKFYLFAVLFFISSIMTSAQIQSNLLYINQKNVQKKEKKKNWRPIHSFIFFDFDLYAWKYATLSGGGCIFVNKGFFRFGLDYHRHHYGKTIKNSKLDEYSFKEEEFDFYSQDIKIIYNLFFLGGKESLIEVEGHDDFYGDVIWVTRSHRKIYLNVFLKQQRYNVKEKFIYNHEKMKVEYPANNYYHIGSDFHLFYGMFKFWFSPSFILNTAPYDDYKKQREMERSEYKIDSEPTFPGPRGIGSQTDTYTVSKTSFFDFEAGIGAVLNFIKFSIIVKREFDNTFFGWEAGIFMGKPL